MHDVIRNIGDVVDRSLPDGFDFLYQPWRRRTDFHAPNDSRRVSRTEIRIQNVDRRKLAGLTLYVLNVGPLTFYFGLLTDRQFPGNAKMRQAVSAIGRHFDIEHKVIVALTDRINGQTHIGQPVAHFFSRQLCAG